MVEAVYCNGCGKKAELEYVQGVGKFCISCLKGLYDKKVEEAEEAKEKEEVDEVVEEEYESGEKEGTCRKCGAKDYLYYDEDNKPTLCAECNEDIWVEFECEGCGTKLKGHPGASFLCQSCVYHS